MAVWISGHFEGTSEQNSTGSWIKYKKISLIALLGLLQSKRNLETYTHPSKLKLLQEAVNGEHKIGLP